MDRDRARLRPVDLARAAGISTQQIRNYEAAGVLPSVPRTQSGYRSFAAVHRHALLAYRALARGYGPDTAKGIMLAVHAGDLPRALAHIDAGHAALHRQRLDLDAASRALEAIAKQAPDGSTSPRSGMRIGEVAARLGVRTSSLRVWEAAGLLEPQREPGTRYRRYGPADIRDAQLVHLLRQSHYSLSQVRSVLGGLRDTGNSDALSAAITQRRTELTERATAMLEGSVHLHRYITDSDG